MKHFNTSLLIVVLISMASSKAFCQATSLVIDNQSPGWLSSKIGYGDQKTVENLKVIGYLNIDDLKFIRNLMQNYSLHGRLDLEDTSIAGTNGGKDDYFPSDGGIWAGGGGLFHLQYFSIPKTLTGGDTYAMERLDVDTFYINTTTGYGKALHAHVKHLVIGENITELVYPALCDFASNTVETIDFPSSLKEISEKKVSESSMPKILVNITDARNLRDFPSLERFVCNMGSEQTPDTIFFPKIKVLSMHTTGNDKMTRFFKAGMHVFIGEDIELLTNLDEEAYGVNLHFTNPIPPVIERSMVYHYTARNRSDFILYVPKGSASAYRACFENGGTNVTIYENPQHVTAIELDKHEIILDINESEILTAEIYPENADDKLCSWESRDPSVAIVDAIGNVTAKKSGETYIYVTSNDGNITDSCRVCVKYHVTDISLSDSEVTFSKLGETKQLFAVVLPENAYDKSVTWMSSSPSVCSVNSSGIITSVGYGTTVISATTTDGGYVATCTVTVYQPVTITATNCSRAYGEENPVFQYTSEGGTLNGTPEISCEATKTSPVGTYPIVISKGSVTNLGDTYVNGTLTITPAPLTISAGNYTKRQGEENPQFNASYEGFKNDESNDVLTKQPTITTSVTKETAPGEYPVVISGAEAQNYSISFINGILKVLEANAIIIKADNKSISYGDAIPELTYTVEGAELQGTPSITCDATSRSSVGTYPIIISKGSVANYNDTYVNGTLTIEKAPLTVSVGDYVKHQGEDNPIFNLTYDGFRNEDGLSSLITIPQATTDATKDSPDGTYDIIISGGNAVNYYFKYVNGTLTVLPTSSGINSVYENMNLDDVTIYAPNGTRRSALQRGINILKMSDGTTRKVIVK